MTRSGLLKLWVTKYKFGVAKHIGLTIQKNILLDFTNKIESRFAVKLFVHF